MATAAVSPTTPTVAPVEPSPPALMTSEEFYTLPDDGIERDLIRGIVREFGMTIRNRRHSPAEARIASALVNWLGTQPEPRGEIVSGEGGFRIRTDPDSTVGIDVAYVSAEIAARNPDFPYFDGPPILAVEILSPSDKQQRIDEKVADYLDCGVAVVWVVNPRFRTVTVYQADAKPTLFNDTQELTAEPHLPGFRVAVARLFAS